MKREDTQYEASVVRLDHSWKINQASKPIKRKEPRCKGCRNPMIKRMHTANKGYCGVCTIDLFNKRQIVVAPSGIR